MSELGFRARQRQEDSELFSGEKFEKFAVENLKKWQTLIEDWVVLGEVQVVHFENLVTSRIAEVKKILNFLKIQEDEQRLKCLQFCNVDLYKRKPKAAEKSPFNENLKNKVWESIRKVNSLLLKYGHEGIPYEKYDDP